MIEAKKIARLSLRHHSFLSERTWKRIPEPGTGVMDSDDAVNDFNEIKKTNVFVSLCGAIELLARMGAFRCQSALDLACGPGHFTIMLAKYAGLKEVTGVDQSVGMLEKAKENAEREGVADRVRFIQSDVTKLDEIGTQNFDLITCTNSAHHMPTEAALLSLFHQMTSHVSPKGMGLVMDLPALKDEQSIEEYQVLMGQEYLDFGYPALFDDFGHSLRAAWTSQRLRHAAQATRSHAWSYFGLLPLPVNQFLELTPAISPRMKKMGCAKFHWPNNTPPVRVDLLGQYKSYRRALFFSRAVSKKAIHASRSKCDSNARNQPTGSWSRWAEN